MIGGTITGSILKDFGLNFFKIVEYLEKIARDKHSSLFCSIVICEENLFIALISIVSVRKSFYFVIYS